MFAVFNCAATAGQLPAGNGLLAEEGSSRASKSCLAMLGLSHVCIMADLQLVHSLQGSFKLDVEEGSFTDSEILVMLGENGTGKTTFIRMLAGMLPPDDEERTEVPEFNVSYKPQKISPKFTSTVCCCLLNAP